MAIFVGRAMLFSGNNHSLKALYIVYTQISYIYKMYLKGIKACCAQAFATVLAVPSEISEEQCLKRIPDLVRNRTVLLRLGSDNSCPSIGLK